MSARDLFVEEGRAVSITEAMAVLAIGGLKTISVDEVAGPCPACGGTDRFAVKAVDNVWVCRGATGGRDAIGLAAHVLGLDVRRQEDFLRVCAALLGREPPGADAETDAERRQREDRLAARRRETAQLQAQREARALDHREVERGRARGKWQHGQPNGDHQLYLARRLDCYRRELPVAPFLRTIERETYWHGQDERRNPVELFVDPAMVAPFVDPDGLVIGCHLTWIDLDHAPKFRPQLRDALGEALPTKKMRGSKKGGLIPLIGFYQDGPLIRPDLNRPRLVAGEGIENVLAIAMAEGPRADSLYVAAGDLGNLAGPADPASRFTHPELRKADRRGIMRAVQVQGPVPKPDQGPDEAMPFHPHLRDVLLVADGDSEIYATGAAMGRAKRRAEALGATADIAWPPAGRDFADLVSGTR